MVELYTMSLLVSIAPKAAPSVVSAVQGSRIGELDINWQVCECECVHVQYKISCDRHVIRCECAIHIMHVTWVYCKISSIVLIQMHILLFCVQAVSCESTNGEITQYAVRYNPQGSSFPPPLITFSSSLSLSITGLQVLEMYEIDVAAETSVGRGVFSQTIIATTSEWIIHVCKS